MAMEYLKTLGLAEIITYLELEPKPGNFKRVQKILSSREEDLEKYKKKCTELLKALEENEKKRTELLKALEENEKKSIEMEGRLEEFAGYKVLHAELVEKVTKLEEEFRTISESNLSLTQDKTALSDKLQSSEEERRVEHLDFTRKSADLEGRKRKAEGEIEVLKKRCEQLETMMKNSKEVEQNLEMSKNECSKLLASLEEEKKKRSAMEDMVQELNKYRMTCDELKGEVARLEENSKMAVEREKAAVQHVTNLTADVENLKRIQNEERIGFKTKCTDLECARQKTELEIEALKRNCKELDKMARNAKELEKKLEKSKVQSWELSIALEEKRKVGLQQEDMIKELESYRTKYDNLYKTVGSLEQGWRKANAKQKEDSQTIQELSGNLEKLKTEKDAELNELQAKTKDLEQEKQKVEEEITIQKRRCQELEKMVKNSIDLEKDMKISKEKCSELLTALEEEKKKSLAMGGIVEELKEYKRICEGLKETVTSHEESCRISEEKEKRANEKINDLTSHLEKLNGDNIKEVNELRRKIKDLEFAKQKAEDEINDQKQRYEEMEQKMKHLIGDLEKKLRKSKAQYTELSTSLEVNQKELAGEGQLEELKKYKEMYTEMKEKITVLQKDYEIISDRGKSGFTNLLGDLAKFELNETSAAVCNSQVSPKANVDARAEGSKNKRKKDENKQGNVQSKPDEGVTGDCSSNLRIKLKTPACDGRASDSMDADAVGQSTPEVNVGGKVKVSSHKRQRKQKSELFVWKDDASIKVDKLHTEQNKKMVSGTDHRSDNSGDKCLVPCGDEHSAGSMLHSVSPTQGEQHGKGIEGIPVGSPAMIKKPESSTADHAKDKTVSSHKRKRKQKPELFVWKDDASIKVDKPNTEQNRKMVSGTDHRSDNSGDKYLVPCGGEHSEGSRLHSVSPTQGEKHEKRIEGIPLGSPVMTKKLGSSTADRAKDKTVSSHKRKQKKKPELFVWKDDASIEVGKQNTEQNKKMVSGTDHRSDNSGEKDLVPCGVEHSEDSRLHSVSPKQGEVHEKGIEGIPVGTPVMIKNPGSSTSDHAKDKRQLRRIIHPPDRLNL